MAGGTQGNIADAMISLLKFHVGPAIKLVDDFILFLCPVPSSINSITSPIFSFNLSTILKITKPLGIPWHPWSKRP